MSKMYKHSAQIIADSVSEDGVRLTTMVCCMPRIVLAELNTHRKFSRNSASSRAIPVEKMLSTVESNPYIPSSWGKNQKGMQAYEELGEDESRLATNLWLEARKDAVGHARLLKKAGVHKQTTNRLLEPFMWHTVIITATDWDNFFHLRNHHAAHPDIQKVAALMQHAYESNAPSYLPRGAWHLPFTEHDIDNSLGIEDWKKISVARCARVSYLTHDGNSDLQADINLYNRLVSGGHLSPLEHVATPAVPVLDLQDAMISGRALLEDKYEPGSENLHFGNLRGWRSMRSFVPNEHDILGNHGNNND